MRDILPVPFAGGGSLVVVRLLLTMRQFLVEGPRWSRCCSRLDGLFDEPRASRQPATGVDHVEAVVVTTPDVTGRDFSDVATARKRIAGLEAELAIHRRAAELPGGVTSPEGGSESFA
jgi:hypothetical protein